MTTDEALAALFRFATGWLGWSPSTALAAPIPMIEAAIAGRVEMLSVIFGGGETSKRHPPLTPETFDALFPERMSK